MPHECFADEIAIDFPSVGSAVERICDAFLGERMEGEGRNVLHADVSLSPREASGGLVISVEVPVRTTCPHCGGRGETWTEPCDLCRGTGESRFSHAVRLPVPAGVPDGARLRFRLRSPDASLVRVEVRVAIRSSAV
jgi:DnaJ-class molecular chaperone